MQFRLYNITTQQKMNNQFWPDENSIEQCFNCCLHCSRLSTILFNIVTSVAPSSGSTTCLVLLTTLNNVGSKILFNAVFIRPEQVVYFWLCIPYTKNTIFSLLTTSPGGVYSPLVKSYKPINGTPNTGNISQFHILTTIIIKSKQSS